jgi:hypothetical protein
VNDPKTKSDVQTSGTLIFQNRLVSIPVNDCVEIKGNRHRVIGYKVSDDEMFAFYTLTKEERAERSI